MKPRINSISISGLRTLDEFELNLRGLTVLIGENGSGKSTVVEAFELLQRLTSAGFLGEYAGIHGGDGLLLRPGSPGIRMRVDIANPSAWTATYEVSFLGQGILSETLSVLEPGAVFCPGIDRNSHEVHMRGRGQESKHAIKPFESALGQVGRSHPDRVVHDAIDSLRNIDVHLPFDTLSHWASKSQSTRVAPTRDAVTVAPVEKLERFAANLPNAFFELRNETSEDEWDYTMELVRMGLGDWVESVNTRADASGGKIGLWVKRRHTDQQIPAASLSDGQLAYLAFVALVRVPCERSILCFDELEQHLHPRLLSQVVSLLESVAEEIPVLVTTHSRRLLDLLEKPAESVRVLELNPHSLRTEIRQMDAATLDQWLQDYEGLGRILDAGYPESEFVEPTSEGTDV